MISADVSAKIIAKEYLKKNANFVLDLRLSKGLREFIYENGGNVAISKVGQINIKQRMVETKAIMGVEASGHINHGKLLNIDDALLSSLILMKQLKKSGKKLSSWNKELTKYFQTEADIKVKNKEKALLKIRNKYKDARMQFLDGVSLNNADWWGVIRPSNTENLIRISVEGISDKTVKKIMTQIKSLLRSS